MAGSESPVANVEDRLEKHHKTGSSVQSRRASAGPMRHREPAAVTVNLPLLIHGPLLGNSLFIRGSLPGN